QTGSQGSSNPPYGSDADRDQFMQRRLKDLENARRGPGDAPSPNPGSGDGGGPKPAGPNDVVNPTGTHSRVNDPDSVNPKGRSPEGNKGAGPKANGETPFGLSPDTVRG